MIMEREFENADTSACTDRHILTERNMGLQHRISYDCLGMIKVRHVHTAHVAITLCHAAGLSNRWL